MIRRHHSPRRLRHPRAAEFIEFVLLLPFLIFFTTFAVDMGRITMLQTAVQGAVQQVARGGAQNGGWDFVDNTWCQSVSGTCSLTSEPYTILNEDIQATPFGSALKFITLKSYAFAPDPNNPSAKITYGADWCANNANPYIYAYASFNARSVFLTPGLYTLLGVDLGSNWVISATSVARADVCH